MEVKRSTYMSTNTQAFGAAERDNPSSRKVIGCPAELRGAALAGGHVDQVQQPYSASGTFHRTNGIFVELRMLRQDGTPGSDVTKGTAKDTKLPT